MESYPQLLTIQKKYLQEGKTQSIPQRQRVLKKLREEIIQRKELIEKALHEDFLKNPQETFMTEIMGTLDEIDLAIKKLPQWSKPQRVRTPLSLFKGKSYIYREPYGCVLIISPWNYPFLLSLNPMIGAIAAGNTCIIKPSEIAPHTSSIIKSLIEAVFDEGHCAVVEGGIPETTALLSEKFDFIHYTGGERVGKIIALKAASTLTPIVLELGGKSPCIVDETADLKIAARRITWGKFINAGQTCIAPDYLLVHQQVKDQLIEEIKKTLQEFYGESIEGNKDYCSIINKDHFKRLLQLMEGLTVTIGGTTNDATLQISPTLLEGVTWESPIMQEEIFGPLLPLMTYDSLDTVISQIKDRPKPLALYLFSQNKKVIHRILQDISFGGGCINGTLMHTANNYLPFGGVGNSGIGNYHGKWGFETFSHKKGILKKSTRIDFKIPYPPYGKKKLDIEKWYTKRPPS